MFKNYLTSAWRNLLKGKLYSAINLLGLSIGTAVVILLSLYVYDEWSFDKFHTKSNRIYRAWVKEHVQDQVFFNTVTPYILGQELRDNFPEIASVVRYSSINMLVKKGNFSEREDIHLVEPEFLDVFDFPLIRGTKDAVFSELHSAVITEDIAKKYFGDPDAIGQTLTMQVGGNWTDFRVTGIIDQAPGNSSLSYGILLPFKNTESYISEAGRTSWTNVNVETFVLLNEQNNVKELEEKVAPFLDDKVSEMYKPGEYLVGFQPYTDIHLNRDFPEGFILVSDGRYPYILSGVAILILLLACINFTTLAVGRSVSRAKEIGVRKATGAGKMQIMLQFWSEAILTSTIGVLFGVGIAHAFLREFILIADKQLAFNFTPMSLLALGGLALITGLLAGVYPSLVLSGFSPVRALRGNVSNLGSEKHLLLHGLVGFQFLLSILLIICTLVMTHQLQYLQNKNLGFNKEQLVIVPYMRSGLRLGELFQEGKTTLGRLRHELSGKPQFSDMAISTQTIGTQGWLKLGYTDTEMEKFRNFYTWGIDDRMFPMLNIALAEGRNFSSDAFAENRAVIVNETYAREYNVTVGGPLQNPFQEYTVIGIAKDFNYESLHTTVQPLLMSMDPIPIVRIASDLTYNDFPGPRVWIKVSGENLAGTISILRQAWHEVAPEQPFNYVFLDENIDRQYRSEARLSDVISIATFLAVLIACLGLFGIVTLTVSRRTKEIGIRKVLGASSAQVVGILSIDFIKLVCMALIPAIPIAWYFMRTWLKDFAYRIDMHWSVFVIGGLIAVLVAFLTVSVQSVRAALVNPVKSLRSE